MFQHIPNEIISHYDEMLDEFPPVNEPIPGTEPGHLRWMLHELNKHEDYGKAMRWLGYIQGILIGWGWTTVSEERDFTRGKF